MVFFVHFAVLAQPPGPWPGLVLKRKVLAIGKVGRGSELTMLADVVDGRVAVGVGPEPPLGAVVSGAVLIASGEVPERERHVAAADPLPVVAVLRVTHGAHPVLRRCVTPEITTTITLDTQHFIASDASSSVKTFKFV